MEVPSVGPEYFNNRLLTKLEDIGLSTTRLDESREARLPFDEKGERESMTVFDFFSRGEGIGKSLNGRVRTFLLRLELNPDYLRTNIESARRLMMQFDNLNQFKRKADQVLADLYSKLSQYDSSRELLYSCDMVKDLASANRVLAYLSTRSKKIEKDYLSLGTVNTYLPDRMILLQKAVDSEKPITPAWGLGDADL